MSEREPKTAIPYPPSWIDRLTAWIERLPGPAWLFYLAGVLLTALLIEIALWIDGSVPFGTYGAIKGIFPPFVFYLLALYHYLTYVGSRSLQAFRPLLDAGEAELARIDYRLTRLPRRWGWASVLLGLITTPPYFLGDRLVFGDLVPRTPLPTIVAVLAAAFFGTTFLAVIVRSIRQLQLVHTLHARAAKVSLLKLEPAHAFSRLTAATGIGVMLVMILGYLYSPGSLGSTWVVLMYLVISSLAAVIFVVPVLGMRERLQQEKQRALDETGDLLQLNLDRLHDRVRDDDRGDVRAAIDAIEALVRERELIGKISTWPWNPATVRGFASTLLLPIFLWLVTRLLERFL
jgi:putative flippase GtrA